MPLAACFSIAIYMGLKSVACSEITLGTLCATTQIGGSIGPFG